MRAIQNPRSVRTVLDLARPYLYRRQGRYILRVRPMGSKRTCSISLKTTHRQTALATASHLLRTLRAFHLDKPDATWDYLRGHLKELAEGILASPCVWDQLGPTGRIYADVREDLEEIAVTEPLSVAQAKATEVSRRMMTAGEWRALGELGPIMDIIEELSPPDSIKPAPQTLEASSPVVSGPVITFATLSAYYMEERGGDLKESSMRSVRTCCDILSKALGDMDMATHTRADLVAIRETLKEGRKATTVNKFMTQLSTVLTWAVDNGHIKQAFCKKLQILKGADSGRIAFEGAQVEALVAHANSLPADSWHRWALTLGAITGARVGEINQLEATDFTEVDGVLVMDINDNDGKSLKNKFSARKVPLVEAYGIDLGALKEFIAAADGRLFTHIAPAFTMALNQRIREVLEIETKVGQSFHSLRHHLAGALKAAEVPLGTAQEILGHSSGSITFDLYGAGRAVQVDRMAEALKVALSVS
ncbi:Integrase [Pseudomonas chlororaphis]